MGVKQYQLGFNHALAGENYLAHRKGKQYDSNHAQMSYDHGRIAGRHEYLKRTREALQQTQEQKDV